MAKMEYNFIKKGFFKNYGADLFISIIIIYVFAYRNYVFLCIKSYTKY